MVRKLLLSSAIAIGMGGVAFAADLPNTKAPPAFAPPPPPIFTWTGVYIGGQIGYQFGTASTFAFTPAGGALGVAAFAPGFGVALPNYNPSGVVGGAHLGYNYQMGQFVAGIEGEVDGSSYNGSTAFGLVSYGSRENIQGSIRGRAGMAWDRFLGYVTGGVAFAGIDNFYSFGPFTSTISHTRVGWTVGAGAEYAIDNNWLIGVEYRYTDYGRYTDFPLAWAPFAATVHETDNRVEARFSYKFDMFAPPAPVVAKY